MNAAANTTDETPTHDDIRLLTRLVALAVLPFLAVASVLLYVFAGETEALFAWTIDPPLTAMLLGSAYLGGIWYFLAVLRGRGWHRVKYGFPAVLVFATLLAIATVVHFDRFHHGHISFITWAGVYAVTPVLVLVAGLRNWGRDDGRADDVDMRIPVGVRTLLIAVGACSLFAGLALYAFPGLFLETWAWPITRLTGRVIGAVLTLPGMVNLWLVVDERWSAFRVLLQAEIVSLCFIVGALVVGGEALDWSRPATTLFVAVIAASLVVFLGVYIRCDRGRHPVSRRQPRGAARR
jgi:hypothetical protein